MRSRATSADVIIIRSEDDASAYRTPIVGDSSVVAYQYHACAGWTLRAILSLPEPGTAQAPMTIEPPCEKCSLPGGLPKPVLIRPLSSWRTS